MNWGKKLVIGMAIFMVFIIGLGATMIVRNSSDALVEPDYYEKGQNYDKDFGEKQKALDDLVVPTISTSSNGVIITFPVPVKYQVICRRASDYHLDRIFTGYTEEDRDIQIRKGELQPGPWLLRIEYTANDKNYLFEGEIVMP